MKKKITLISTFVVCFLLCSVTIVAKETSRKVPALIFCFHDVDGNGRYSVTKRELLQIFNLMQHSYRVLSLKNWHFINTSQKRRRESFSKALSKPIVILTFDDGFPSLFRTVIPLLKKYKYEATFFIYLDRYHAKSVFYEKLAHLPSQFEVGSHSFTHDKLSAKSNNIFKELYLSKKKLESLIQKEIISWAWPYGYYTPTLLEQAKLAGYILQVSTDYRLIQPSDNYENIARYTIQHPKPVRRVKKILKHYNQYLVKVNNQEGKP